MFEIMIILFPQLNYTLCSLRMSKTVLFADLFVRIRKRKSGPSLGSYIIVHNLVLSRVSLGSGFFSLSKDDGVCVFGLGGQRVR
jgi:hypothetical protein